MPDDNKIQDEKFTVDKETWSKVKEGEGQTFAEQFGLTDEQIAEMTQSNHEPDVLEE